MTAMALGTTTIENIVAHDAAALEKDLASIKPDVPLTLPGVPQIVSRLQQMLSDPDIGIPQLVPVITNVRILNKNSGGFDVEVTGYSTSREITSAKFDFGAASGANLLTVELQPNVTGTFTSYYQADASSAGASEPKTAQ